MRDDSRTRRTPRQTNDERWILVGMVGIVVLLGFWVVNGFLSRRDPVPELASRLAQYSEYSIIVDDVNDGFLRNYLTLKSSFQITAPIGEDPDQGEAAQFDELIETYSISDGLVDRYERSIGMVVASKAPDGTLTGYAQSHPPYYQHVGRRQYGYFGPGGFWIFYGQYAFMSAALGGHRINRGDYGAYVGTRNRGQAYYGPQTAGRPTFGANGSVTATTRPSFSQRYQTKQSRFQARAQSRAGSGRSRLGK